MLLNAAELIGLVRPRRRHPIEVFHANQELAVTRAGDQPGHQRRSEVAEVQRTGRRRGKSAAHGVIFHGRCDVDPCDMTRSN